MMLMRKDVDKEQEAGGETGQRITGLGMGTQEAGAVDLYCWRCIVQSRTSCEWL
jgi:hypothetical protein